jgi:signal-transduction protein with cAMP-binding, CBS, and nucleotidyltransferase domain
MSLTADRATLAQLHSTAIIETVESILKAKGSLVWGIRPEATVFEAIALMAEKRIGALMVVSEGRLAGIVSERDYARKVILKGHSSKEMRVDEIMTSPAITVTPESTVADCMHLITNHRIRHLPVCDGDRLVGVVSIGDVVNAIISAQADTIRQLNSYIAGEYPA